MHRPTRRSFIAGAGSTALLAGCASTNPQQSSGGTGALTIDARVDETMEFLFRSYPATRNIASRSVAQLVMPVITKAGFIIGAAYGTGALRQDGITVDYYSAASGTIGYQIGAQQFSHVLLFMSQDALRRFRTSSGFEVDLEAEYAFVDAGGNLSAQQFENAEVIAFVFGQTGLAAGASLRGTKYTVINPN